MGVVLTAPGEALIARLQAEGKPLVIDQFLFANIEGQDHTQQPAINGVVPPLAHSRPIPPEYRAFASPSQVVYSALLGSDVGDFAFNWQGLLCSEHNTLVAVATFPSLQKKAYNAATNAPGNNLTRNFMLQFSGAQALTQITVEAKVWQLDFTVRLLGADERERLSNRDIYGRGAFLGDGWLLKKTGSDYAFLPGTGYVEGIRVALAEALTARPDALPCDVYLDVCQEIQGSDRVNLADPVYFAAGTPVSASA